MEQSSDEEWVRELTKTVGERVAFYRQRTVDESGRKLTAQGLADRCEKIGLKIDRPAIAKLERGHRLSVSLAEVLVLAEALRVPPVQLLFPVGYVAAVEILPGRTMDPYDALGWFAGRPGDYASPDAVRRLGANSSLVLWSTHLAEEHNALAWSTDAHQARGTPEAESYTRLARESAAGLARVREAMREEGMTPPDLHPVSARLVGDEEVSGG